MRRTIWQTVILVSLLAIAACETESPARDSTLIINATVFDGSGNPGIEASLRINGDRIIALGDLNALDGETVINAGGLALAPGFIDTHSHHDRDLRELPHMPGVLSQGITTIVRGNDGSADNFESVAAFNETFEQAPAAVNVASFSPHNTIRRQVMTDDSRRHASPDEIQAMSALVAKDMGAGALGLSTGLEYEPGIFSATTEIIELARVAAQHGGRYSSHLRDEDDRFVDAINEIIQVGTEAGIPVHISHIKIADRLAWGTTREIIHILDLARANGVRVTADIYPYERWASNLAVLFPERNYASREVAEFTFARTAAPDDIFIVRYPPNPKFEGMTIAEIATVTERDNVSTLLELSQAADDHRHETGEDTGIIAKSMNNEDIADFMQWPYTNICSDGAHGGHPRGYGSFPRVLGRFVREHGVLSLPDAIHKMTGRSADSMGIAERGRIEIGHYADLVLFDPQTIIDHATMADPKAVSTGIRRVWVNGVLVLDDGEPTHTYPGRVVRRAQ